MRIGEELTLEALRIDDRVELVGVDAGRAVEGQHHLVIVRAGFDLERHAAALGRAVVDRVGDLGLQVAVDHQPLAQRFGAVVGTLLVEDTAMPLPANFVLSLPGRRETLEPHLDERSASDTQGQVGLVALDLSLEADAVLHVPERHQVRLDFGHLFTNREEVVGVSGLDVELVANQRILLAGLAVHHRH